MDCLWLRGGIKELRVTCKGIEFEFDLAGSIRDCSQQEKQNRQAEVTHLYKGIERESSA